MFSTNLISKKGTTLLLLGGLLLTLLAALYLVRQQQETRRGATGSGVIQLKLNPASGAKAQGSNFQVSLTLTNSAAVAKEIRAAGADLQFDPAVFEVSEVTCDPANLPGAVKTSVEGNKIYLSCYRQGGTGPLSIPAGATIGLGTFKVTVKSAAVSGSTQITFARTMIPEEGTIADLSDQGQPAVFTIGFLPLQVRLNPASGNKALGSSFPVDVTIKNVSASSQQFRAAGVDLQFDPAVFTPSSVVCDTTSLPGSAQARVDNNKIYLSCFRQGGSEALTIAPGQTLNLGKFDLAVKSNAPQGASPITFLRVKITSAASTSTDIADGGETATYTIGSGATGDVTVNFKVKFSGVNSKIDDQLVVVRVKKPGVEKEYRDVTVTSNDAGVLSGTVVLTGVSSGDGYFLYVKGPKHLAEKFCINSQTTRCRFGQSLTLALTNTFDFSGFALEPGDIPNAAGVQDGLVDGNDFGVLKQSLLSTDESLRARANLDFDKGSTGNNLITGRDVVLFLDTLRQRYDDDN